jgi:pantoate--beta-alanine ligase
VNPTQFNTATDLETYPRDEPRDLQFLEDAGVSLVFAPSPDEMYSPHFQTTVSLSTITQGLEGAARPGHFDGVATVVTKLLNIAQADRVYFGQKDAQQVAVIKQLVRDLNIPVEIVVAETQRESDGLAMSSRNARLSEKERVAAAVLYRALQAALTAYESGENRQNVLHKKITDLIQQEPLARIDYISFNHADTLVPANEQVQPPLLISMAVFIGDVRLIDNVVIR